MDTSKKQILNNLSKLFSETKILDPVKNEKILFKEVWEKNSKPLVLVHWLRRFGWPLCRMGALDLTSALIEAGDEIKNKLNYLAIGLAKLDYEDFIKGDYFKDGLVYIDEDKETYKALQFGVKGVFSLFGALNPGIYSKMYEASKRGITGNMQGDGFQLGGTLIIKNNGEVIFRHVQKTYSDQPKIEDILKAVSQN